MHVLVTSPIPSHPQNHGNRARVFSVCKALQARGCVVHFVYGGLEGLTPAQETAMRRTWDHTYVLSSDRVRKKQSGNDHHLIDDWYPEEMTALTARIMRIWNIEVCLANYVWCSKWLEIVPAGIPRIIDTHDIFADRNARLAKDGIDGVWFSTTRTEEAKAIARADTILAIQDVEATHFSTLGHRDVRVLGHLAQQNFADAKPGSSAKNNSDKLKVGYMASDNPINQHSLSLLADAIKANDAARKACHFSIAGALSNTSAAQQPFFDNLGFVDDAAAFHRSMDAIINPNIGGTGLKIKSIDALSFGVPLAATRDAMIGISTSEPLHLCESVPALVAQLVMLAGNRHMLTPLADAGRSVFKDYQSAQQQTLDTLFSKAASSPSNSEPLS